MNDRTVTVGLQRCDPSRHDPLPGSFIIRIGLAALMIATLRCAGVAPPAEVAGVVPGPASTAGNGERIHAVAWVADGSEILVASNVKTGCALSAVDPESGVVSLRRTLSFCPDRISPLRDGTLLLAAQSKSLWLDAHGASVGAEKRQVIAAIDLRTYVVREDRGLVWVLEGLPLRVESSLEHVVMVGGGSVLIGVYSGDDGESLVRVDREGSTSSISGDLFVTIDSFEVSPDGKELVVATTRDGMGSDVALISIDGGEPHWIAPERFEETTATWAPRGSKVSYIVHAAGGSVMRTVHVPTSYQLTVDFPWSQVLAIAWEPKAERVAVVVSEPFSSDRLEVVGYGGEDKRTVIPAVRRIEATLEPLPEAGSGVYFASPAVVRYDERSSVMIRVGERSDFDWKGGAAHIRTTSDCGLVFARAGLGALDAQFWSALQSLPWFDPDRVFIVSRGEVTAAELARLDPRVIVIGHAGDGVAAKSFVEVPVEDDVDSFATDYIRDRLARP